MFDRLKVAAVAAAMAAAFGAVAALAAFASTSNSSGLKTTQQVAMQAPDFAGIDTWINSAPLHLEQLRGKVVLVDFWTFDCINCAHTLPHVKDWYARYRDKGLVVVGVHTPEYTFERDTGNLKQAIKRYGIEYPVAQDNQYATWNAYGNQYWPALYLIDQNGKVVYSHFGEGRYAQTEEVIRDLLGLSGKQG
ncbi:thioredoxin family protein [Caballeronia ptereochthonis]|jgi:thiol-disulfide isomerase/thioredoxin|uniref:Redoxin domain-containing protein n=1 Tax=Caballeronia ptereochthonis TaxID=1777144 RepID=A0A158BDM8_9BURK|nr:thioredoxin family protein [Caballeronia ptereochthonis]SAK67467.1 redoxin domain-containing protein [Caballeronia ptereochthonis]